MAEELIDLGFPSNFNDSAGLRAPKYIRPECNTVRNGDTIVFQGCRDTPAWGKGECPHDPYTSVVERRETKPTYEQLEDGRFRVTGEETIVWHEKAYNISQVPFSIRINSGRGPEYYRALGWKDPAEVGLKPFCDYIGCYAQRRAGSASKPLLVTEHGRYCSEDHAKIIAADENEDKLEILDAKKRKRQLAAIAV